MFSILYQGNNFSKSVVDNINSYSKNGFDVVVSTWEENQIDDLFPQSVTIVKIKDPGADDINGELNNYTRHINGVLAGLHQCKEDYVLKLRSDITIDIEKFQNVVDFERLNVVDVTTKIYGSFHFCDWLYFEKKKNLILMFERINKSFFEWASIEELLFISYVHNSDRKYPTPKIIVNREINLKYQGWKYKIIPFGKNVALMPSSKRIKEWNNKNYTGYFKGFNDFFIIRYLLYLVDQLLRKIYKCF